MPASERGVYLAKGQHETASRLKQRITAIMRYAVQEDMITHNPANELGGT